MGNYLANLQKTDSLLNASEKEFMNILLNKYNKCLLCEKFCELPLYTCQCGFIVCKSCQISVDVCSYCNQGYVQGKCYKMFTTYHSLINAYKEGLDTCMIDIYALRSLAVDKLHKCWMCLDTMDTPISMCQTGHDVCQSCRESTTICPCCSAAYICGRNRITEEFLDIVKNIRSRPKPASSIYKNLIEEICSVLECSICLKILSPPIAICSNGHDICCWCFSSVKKCPTCRGEYLHGKNLRAEIIASLLPYSCSNIKDGCNMYLMDYFEKVKHDEHCAYKKYNCLYFNLITTSAKCKFRGTVKELQSHVTTFHKAKINDMSQKSLHLVPYFSGIMCGHCHLLEAHDELFWWHYYQDSESGLFEHFQYIGPYFKAKYFSYELEYTHPSGYPQFSFLLQCTSCLDTDFELLCDEKKCAFIRLNDVKSVIEDDMFKFSYKIHHNR